MIDKNKAIKNGIKVIDSREVKNEMFDNLKNNFPQTIKDGVVDLKTLTSLLGQDLEDNIGGYELTFTGKGLANALYNSPCNKELKLDEIFDLQAKNKTFNANNFIIRGDNLDALKLLKSAYSEKIKMIYIDPPYNTNNDNFIYPDNFRDDFKAILREVGLIEINEKGEETESENLKFFKNIAGTRTHSAWLCFMLPRLKLARDLLKDDGVIFISIDDNEQANLKLLCDEIFGEDNFISTLIWHSKNKPSGNTTENKTIDIRTEYILCYAKNNFLANKYENTKEELKEKGYILQDEYFKERGHYKLTPLMRSCSASSFNYLESLDYEIQAPDGTMFKNHQNIKKPKSYCYTWSKKLFDFGNANGFIEFQKTSEGFWCAYRKMYEFCTIDNKKLEIIYRKSGNAYNNLITEIYSDMGANEVRNLMNGEKVFTYAKPTKLIKHLLKISTSANAVNNEPDIILDFFAGSGTTAQAVMELNKEDGGNRQFILVQLDEKIDEKKSKTAFDFCKNELKSKNPVISDITIERVKRATKKITIENKTENKSKNNLGFKVFALDDKPEIFEKESRILELIDKRNLNKMDIVINMALISGKTLDKKIETVFDGKLYKLEDSYYLINCDKEILKYLTKIQNEYIFIDAYGNMELEDFLNLDAGFKERLIAVY